jgi:L-lactate dehydrogenase
MTMMRQGTPIGKVGIVGSGFVGATAAYAMVLRGVGREIVLVDLNHARAEAEADDIRHAVPFAYPVNVHAGDYADLAGCRAVVISAGVNQRPGETRLQLLERNAAVFRQVVPSILAHAPDALLVVATNPVDVMTHYTARLAAEKGIASSRVVGSGTTLDTARFRTLLSSHLGVDAQHVHAYVIGEHGDSEVLTWSQVSVAGMPFDEFCRQQQLVLDDEARQRIDQQVRRAAYTIIAGKGATYYGVGAALARIVDVILRNQRAILTVCSPIPDVLGIKDVTISLPNLVSGEGVVGAFLQPLRTDEEQALAASARVVKDAIDCICY